MRRLFLLYAVDKILDYSTSFFESWSITSTTFKSLRELREKLFEEIRPDAINYVEAFQYSDNTLMSAIGRADGRPYTHLLECFRNSNDINKPKVAAEFREVSKDLRDYNLKLNKAKL
jgi:cell division protein FtsI/penicillin-binding protein 2